MIYDTRTRDQIGPLGPEWTDELGKILFADIIPAGAIVVIQNVDTSADRVVLRMLYPPTQSYLIVWDPALYNAGAKTYSFTNFYGVGDVFVFMVAW